MKISELSRAGQVCPQPPLLVPQIEDGGPQPQLGNFSPYELSVLGVDDAEPHQAVLVHPDQAAASDLLLQEGLGVQMVVVATVSPQPLLDINNGPSNYLSKISATNFHSYHCWTDLGLWVLAARDC